MLQVITRYLLLFSNWSLLTVVGLLYFIYAQNTKYLFQISNFCKPSKTVHIRTRSFLFRFKLIHIFLHQAYWFSERSQITKKTLFWQKFLCRRQIFEKHAKKAFVATCQYLQNVIAFFKSCSCRSIVLFRSRQILVLQCFWYHKISF